MLEYANILNNLLLASIAFSTLYAGALYPIKNFLRIECENYIKLIFIIFPLIISLSSSIIIIVWLMKHYHNLIPFYMLILTFGSFLFVILVLGSKKIFIEDKRQNISKILNKKKTKMTIKNFTDSKNLFLSIIGGVIVALVVLVTDWMGGAFKNNIHAYYIGLFALILLFLFSIWQYNKSPKKE
ncbi:MAG: hypothetical protein NT001_06905 [Candidatus Woesearchaeota archaeon]|nr:hypothetical protein [Candidatus Woesearchaeota archaeon]